mmetsp:Transcript_95555/g.227628  ORF Transcript_95555/g.227628 Transcript_95555/m.227628 type:complete len:213 (+) Transcript_95555:2724-3362(+)
MVGVSGCVVEVSQDGSENQNCSGEARPHLLLRFCLELQQLGGIGLVCHPPRVRGIASSCYLLSIVLLVGIEQGTLQDARRQCEKRHGEDTANAHKCPRQQSLVKLGQGVLFQQIDHDIPHGGGNGGEPLPFELVSFPNDLAVGSVGHEVEAAHHKPYHQAHNSGNQEQLAIICNLSSISILLATKSHSKSTWDLPVRMPLNVRASAKTSRTM